MDELAHMAGGAGLAVHHSQGSGIRPWPAPSALNAPLVFATSPRSRVVEKHVAFVRAWVRAAEHLGEPTHPALPGRCRVHRAAARAGAQGCRPVRRSAHPAPAGREAAGGLRSGRDGRSRCGDRSCLPVRGLHDEAVDGAPRGASIDGEPGGEQEKEVAWSLVNP